MLDGSRVLLASPPGCRSGRHSREAPFLLALVAALGLPLAVAAAPPVPSEPAVACGAVVSGECYVGGAFTLSSYSAGAHRYAICRSNDTTGWGGCDVLVTANTGSLSTISGSHLPSNGYRRAYYVAACDAANSCTAWGASPPAYVRMDQTGPAAPGNTSVSCAYASGDDCWVLGNFIVSASPASDSGSGVSGYRICRSVDIAGWGGCDYDMVGIGSGGTSFTVSGTNLPSDGYRRAYYFAGIDRVGNSGAWNNPRFVRVDRYWPTVSATNSSTQWFTSRTATVSAADSTGGASANSGLASVRYRWNGSLDMACVSGGTATYSGAVLSAPEGANTLYLCARDNTGRSHHWNGYYYVDAGPPTAPGPTTVACAYTVGGVCWVTGDFVVSVTAAADTGTGVAGYRICRTVDTTGWSGCDYDMVPFGTGGTSFTVSGSNLPSDGYWRGYYFAAKDSAGNWGPWNSPRFVKVDRYAPTVSATNSSTSWFASRTATLSAADATGGAAANSGLHGVRYRWNAGLDAACMSAGTATSSGTTLTVPEGDNTLYLCARDQAGRVTHWSGTFRVDSGPPTAPGPTTVACAYIMGGECWVIGNFVVNVTPATDHGAGVAGYRICRTVDTTGWSGCDHDMVPLGTGGTSFTVSGSNLPSDGYWRGYYFAAKDANGNWGPWNSPRFVKIDRYSPTVSGTGSSSHWTTSNFATVTAFDTTGGSAANSGVAGIRFRWNGALNGACTDGTAVAHGGIVPAPEGSNTLHLCARDLTGRVGTWSGPFAVDSTGPTLDSLTVSAGFWSIGDGSTYQITAKTSDAGSGVQELRALINLHGSNTANPRGNFSWRDQSLGYLWTADQVPCAGGGYASKRPDAYNPDTISLVGCSTTLVGAQRTVVFTVRPHASFGEFGAIHDISFWARDVLLNPRGWQHFDLNFASGLLPPPVLQVLGPTGAGLANGATVAWGDVDQGAGSGVLAKTITVKNAAPAGSGNLVLEHSPSNVEITGSGAFTLGGSLVSPLGVGAQDGFNVRLNTNQVGQHSAQLKIWHNDPARPNPAVFNLSARVLAKPVVTGTTPDVIFQGLSTTITVNGQHLQGASVYIASQPFEEGGTSNRVYPTAQLVSVNGSGTQLMATINAQAAGIEGFYNLGIETQGGATGAQFRVVGAAPVIDVFTPAQTVQGQIHVLTITGVNLAGANLVPSSSGVKILDLDNSDDRSLMGLLYIESGAPAGNQDIRVEGPGGFAEIPIQVESSESHLTLETRRLEIPGKSGQPDVPDVLLQQPVSLLHLQKGLFKSNAAIDPAAAMGPDEPHYLTPSGEQVTANEVDEKLSFCFTYVYRARRSFSAILLSLTDQFGNPLTRAVLDALAPGSHLDFNSMTLGVAGFLEIEFVFRVCDDWVTDVIFCFRGGISFMVPLLGGQSFTFDICAGNGGTSVTLAASGFITNHVWSSSNSCLAIRDVDPASQSGARAGEIDSYCCEDATLSLHTAGQVFGANFDVGGEVAEVEPTCGGNCADTDSQGETGSGVGSGLSQPLTTKALCVRTPLGPGKLSFQGCTASQLGAFAVMPENAGPSIRPPVSGHVYGADGMWVQGNLPVDEWLKVPDHCTATVTCSTGSNWTYGYCCNICASQFKGTVRWSRDPHGTPNPFAPP